MYLVLKVTIIQGMDRLYLSRDPLCQGQEQPFVWIVFLVWFQDHEPVLDFSQNLFIGSIFKYCIENAKKISVLSPLFQLSKILFFRLWQT